MARGKNPRAKNSQLHTVCRKDHFKQSKIILPYQAWGVADSVRDRQQTRSKKRKCYGVDAMASDPAAITTHLMGDLAFIVLDETNHRPNPHVSHNARLPEAVIRTACNDVAVDSNAQFVGVVNTMTTSRGGKPQLGTINAGGTDQITNTGDTTIYAGELVYMEIRPTLTVNNVSFIKQEGYPPNKLRPSVYGQSHFDALLTLNAYKNDITKYTGLGAAELNKFCELKESLEGSIAEQDGEASVKKQAELMNAMFLEGVNYVQGCLRSVIGRAHSTALPGADFDISLFVPMR
jgi:hypothetical protein